jgi:hypothetical protein
MAQDLQEPFQGPAEPRVGGILGAGTRAVAWTGGSNIQDPTRPRSIDAYRPVELKDARSIYEACTRGLQEKVHLGKASDVADKTKNTVGLTTWLKLVAEHMERCGMDTVFRISNGTRERNLLKEWGGVTTEVVDEWIEDLMETGALQEDGTRSAVCPYDIENLEWSAVFIKASITVDLWMKIEPTIQFGATGPQVLHRIVIEHQSEGAATVRNLVDELRSIKLKEQPGEDVSAMGNRIIDLCKRIEGSGQAPSDMSLLVCQCFLGSSTPEFENSALTLINMVDADVTSFRWDSVVLHHMKKFDNLVQRKGWIAKQTKKEDPVKAMQAKLTKLEKSMKKPGTGTGNHADKTCFHCQKKGHISPNCPDKDKPKVEPANKTNDKEKKDKSPIRTPPKDGEPTTKTVDGVLMKWCKKCGRWTKGDKLHSTEEHKPKTERGTGEGNGSGGTTPAAAGGNAAGLRIVPRAYCCPVYCKICFESGYHSPEKCPKLLKKNEQTKKIERQVKESPTYAQATAMDYLNWMASKGQAGPSCYSA